jgi:hypothetical protein
VSDVAPPTYERDLRLMRSWRTKLFEELKLEANRRNREIFKGASRMIAFSYENNRNDDARYRILKAEVERKVNDPDVWAELVGIL